MMQYANCSAPTTARNPRNVSSSLMRCGVCSTYAFHTCSTAPCTVCVDAAELADDEGAAPDLAFGTIAREICAGEEE